MDRLREMQEAITNLQDRFDENDPHRVQKSHSRRRQRQQRRVDDSSKVESEQGEGLMVSFHHAEGTKPFLSLVSRFLVVEIKYLEQIISWDVSRAEHLTKPGPRPREIDTTGDEIQEAKRGWWFLPRRFVRSMASQTILPISHISHGKALSFAKEAEMILKLTVGVGKNTTLPARSFDFGTCEQRKCPILPAQCRRQVCEKKVESLPGYQLDCHG